MDDDAYTQSFLKSLFSPPCLADAFARLPAGRLWAAFLPGADAGAALHLLGEGAAETLAAALAFMPDIMSAVSGTGVPFSWSHLEPRVVAIALLNDGLRVAQRPVPASGPVFAEINLPGRREWTERVNACIDHAANELASGKAFDPLDVMLVAPDVDLRPVVGMADGEARFRLAYGLAGVGGDVGRFRRCYLRRSAAAGMMGSIAMALSAALSGVVGTDETGWSIWWQGSGTDLDHAFDGAPLATLGFRPS